MKNKKQAALGAFILSLLLLALMGCNVGHLTPPPEVGSPTVCPEKPQIAVKLIDLPGNCVAIKEAKLTLTDPNGKCTSQLWKSCAPSPVGFDFTESGCYKFCVEVTGDNGAKFYYSGSFPLELKEQYSVEVRFEKGVITAAFKKLSPQKPKSWIVTNVRTGSDTDEISLSLNLTPDTEEPAIIAKTIYRRSDSNDFIDYTKRTAGEWSTYSGMLGIFGTLTGNSALLFDSKANPILCYTDYRGYRTYLHKILGVPRINEDPFDPMLGPPGFVIEPPQIKYHINSYDDNISSMRPPHLAQDSKGNIHFFYTRRIGRGGMYGWNYFVINKELNDWRISLLPLPEKYDSDGWPVDFILDSKDGYVIVFHHNSWDYDPSTHRYTVTGWFTKYMSYENGQPVYEELTIREAGTYLGESFSLAVNSKDMRAIAFLNDNKELSYAKRVNGEWLVEPVVSGVNSKGECKLAFDSKDRAIITFYDSNSQDLKVARQTGKEWEVTTIDSDGDVGSACVIKVDSKDNIYIAYFDRTNRRVKLAEYR